MLERISYQDKINRTSWNGLSSQQIWYKYTRYGKYISGLKGQQCKLFEKGCIIVPFLFW